MHAEAASNAADVLGDGNPLGRTQLRRQLVCRLHNSAILDHRPCQMSETWARSRRQLRYQLAYKSCWRILPAASSLKKMILHSSRAQQRLPPSHQLLPSRRSIPGPRRYVSTITDMHGPCPESMVCPVFPAMAI